MKIKCIDTKIPRIDGKGKCDSITEGKEYTVLSSHGHMYRVVNDEGQNASYLKIRFEKVEVEQNFKEYFGLCIVHWKSGGRSDAVIGNFSDGSRWIMCSNWTSHQGERVQAAKLSDHAPNILKIRRINKRGL